MNKTELISSDKVQQKIYTIRGQQVMLDEDLAELYGVETKRLNEQVKRNSERFPDIFCFQLTEDDLEILRSQNATSSSDSLRSQFATLEKGRGQHRKYLPYVFTEQGVAMLSAVLKSETAVRMSIQIINAFVTMRRFLQQNAVVFQRLDSLETRQLATDKKLDQVLNALEHKDASPRQGIFFDGQIFDAYQFVASIVRTAKTSIVLIDNYVDDTVLTLFSKRKKGIPLTIFTLSVSKQMALDLKKYNEQYPPAAIKEIKSVHDRFLIIDNTTVYHIGASLKDLGKKWFAFSKMEIGSLELLEKVKDLS